MGKIHRESYIYDMEDFFYKKGEGGISEVFIAKTEDLSTFGSMTAADIRFTFGSNISERSRMCRKQLPDINTVDDNSIYNIPFYKQSETLEEEKLWHAEFKKKYGTWEGKKQWYWYFRGERLVK